MLGTNFVPTQIEQIGYSCMGAQKPLRLPCRFEPPGCRITHHPLSHPGRLFGRALQIAHDRDEATVAVSNSLCNDCPVGQQLAIAHRTMAQRTILKQLALLLDQLHRLGRAVYYTLRPQVIMMKGRWKNSDEIINICHVGVMSRGYRLGFPSQVLRELDEEVDLGIHWLWHLRKLLKENNCTFALVESPQYLKQFLQWVLDAPKETCFLPFYVDGTIQVEDIPNILADSNVLKRDIQKLEKLGFTLQISNDPARYREFLDRYLQPYYTAAHGAMAAMFDYEFLCRTDYPDHDQWELLQIFLDKEWVSGCLAKKTGETIHLQDLGVINGDNGLVKRGALRATYWVLVQRACALGCQKISFMWSPPFLKNGVLMFKKKYRPRLKAVPSPGKGLLLAPMGNNALTHKILFDQPMIQLAGSRLKATVFVEKSTHVAAARDELIKQCRRYGGISDYEVILLDK